MKLTIFRSRNKHLELSVKNTDNRLMGKRNIQTYKTQDGEADEEEEGVGELVRGSSVVEALQVGLPAALMP